MSKFASAQALIKGLTLVPILVLVYYADLPSWLSSLYASHLLAFFVGTLTLFSLYTLLKRKALSAYLELGRGHLPIGLLFLAASAAMYFSGYIYGSLSWFHYESMVLLIVGYVILRLDARIIRTLGPLVLMVALGLPSPFLQPLIGYHLLAVYILAVAVGLSLLVEGVQLRGLQIPLVVAVLSMLYWIRPYWFLPYLIPLSLLLLVPPPLRSVQTIPLKVALPGAGEEGPHRIEGGFCLTCGRKVAPVGRPVRLGLVGLGVGLLLLYTLFVFQVPVLSLSGGAPFSSTYTRTGVDSVEIPQTPPGWVVNTTATPPNTQSEAYAVEKVYVPAYHPESANYTLDYELSQGDTVVTRSFGVIQPWKFGGSVPFQVGEFKGHLLTYTLPNAVMFIFTGTDSMYFMDGGSFTLFNVGVTFMRHFQNMKIEDARSVFTNDLNSLFLPFLSSDVEHSVWTYFLSRVGYSIQVMQDFVATLSLSGLIFWGAYRVKLSDSRQDRFLTFASELDEDEWTMLSALLGRPRMERTGYQVAKEIESSHAGATGAGDATLFLKKLERLGLMRRILSEKGPEVLLLWKLEGT